MHSFSLMVYLCPWNFPSDYSWLSLTPEIGMTSFSCLVLSVLTMFPIVFKKTVSLEEGEKSRPHKVKRSSVVTVNSAQESYGPHWLTAVPTVQLLTIDKQQTLTLFTEKLLSRKMQGSSDPASACTASGPSSSATVQMILKTWCKEGLKQLYCGLFFQPGVCSAQTRMWIENRLHLGFTSAGIFFVTVAWNNEKKNNDVEPVRLRCRKKLQQEGVMAERKRRSKAWHFTKGCVDALSLLLLSGIGSVVGRCGHCRISVAVITERWLLHELLQETMKL